MRFTKLISGSLVVLFIVTFGLPWLSAYDKNHRFKAYNPGLEPCSEIDAMLDRRMKGYTTEQQADYEQIVRYWLAGFGTAWNYIMLDTYDIQGKYTDQQIWDWLENYCEKNPDKKLVDATIILVQALHPNRTRKEPAKK